MNKKSSTTIYLIIIILILTAALGYFAFYKKPPQTTIQSPTPTPSPSTSLQTYNNGSYGFQFQYPPEFAFVTPTGYSNLGADAQQIVQIQANNKNFPSTNLNDYAFTVSNQYNYADCLKSVNTKTPLTETQSIKGVTFYKDATTGAGAGNFYDTQVYRTDKDNWCYELTLTVHTGNIANYPEGTVTEVDKNKVFDILNQVLLTFKFTN